MLTRVPFLNVSDRSYAFRLNRKDFFLHYADMGCGVKKTTPTLKALLEQPIGTTTPWPTHTRRLEIS